jgi:hypothetical protein
VKRPENRAGPWLSTAHGDQHKPGGGDELTAADIGAAPIEHTHAATPGAEPTALSDLVGALQAEMAVLRAELKAHKAAKAGVVHK